MAIKQAAMRPAPGVHNSFVRKYVAMAVRPLKIGARNTHMSLKENEINCQETEADVDELDEPLTQPSQRTAPPT